MSLVLRSSLPPAQLEAAAAEAVRAVDPGQPIFAAATLGEILDESMAARRFSAVLLGIFAGLALLLAAIGIYGVVAFLTSLRSREIAVRMALGARGGDVVRLVFGQSLAPVLAGLAAGSAGAVGVAQALSGLLYGVSPFEPAAFAGTAICLVVVAAAATLVPARRATRIEPMAALRQD
jgi:putative ABC transport system permease protein